MRGELGIFPVHLYREKAIYDDSHFQVPDPIHGAKLGIFPSPRAYMRKCSEFFQVPEHLYREKGIYEPGAYI